MEAMLNMIVIAGVIVMALMIMVGKISPGEGVFRIGAWVLCLCIAPLLASLLHVVVLVALKPLLLLLLIVAAVTVCVKLLLRMLL